MTTYEYKKVRAHEKILRDANTRFLLGCAYLGIAIGQLIETHGQHGWVFISFAIGCYMFANLKYTTYKEEQEEINKLFTDQENKLEEGIDNEKCVQSD